jgi:hypothetical protein
MLTKGSTAMDGLSGSGNAILSTEAGSTSPDRKYSCCQNDYNARESCPAPRHRLYPFFPDHLSNSFSLGENPVYTNWPFNILDGLFSKILIAKRELLPQLIISGPGDRYAPSRR